MSAGWYVLAVVGCVVVLRLLAEIGAWLVFGFVCCALAHGLHDALVASVRLVAFAGTIWLLWWLTRQWNEAS